VKMLFFPIRSSSATLKLVFVSLLNCRCRNYTKIFTWQIKCWLNLIFPCS
jgi:hypothetical protein